MFDALASLLADRYGLSVEVGLSPAGGDATMAVEYANLRNGVIRLSAARSEEQQGFVLAHVFGHLVQYLDAQRYASLIRKVEKHPPIRFSSAEETAYFGYEMEAFAWGEALMRACGPLSAAVLNRYRAFAATDFQTYLDYLKTGVQTDADTFQETFAVNAARSMPAVWDCAAMELPPELITADVSISVL